MEHDEWTWGFGQSLYLEGEFATSFVEKFQEKW
jgi:hypothetical protein